MSFHPADVVEEVHEDHAEDGHAFEDGGFVFGQRLCRAGDHAMQRGRRCGGWRCF